MQKQFEANQGDPAAGAKPKGNSDAKHSLTMIKFQAQLQADKDKNKDKNKKKKSRVEIEEIIQKIICPVCYREDCPWTVEARSYQERIINED